MWSAFKIDNEIARSPLAHAGLDALSDQAPIGYAQTGDVKLAI